MKTLKRILVPTDLSEASRVELDYALLFADTFGADLTLFYADPMHFEFDLLTGAPVYVSGVSMEERSLFEKDVRAYADQSLRRRPYRVVIGAGDPVATIAREARDTSIDLIVMATHGQRGWRRTALGSVTEGVVHEATCPVLSVARSDARRALLSPAVTRVVCPINFSDVSRDALRVATSIARMFACELVVAHVVENAAGEPAMPEMPADCTSRQVVLRGGAAERILDYVEDTGADLLVIGAQRKLFRDATVIGTTTERLIRFARVPVLSVVSARSAQAQLFDAVGVELESRR